MISSLNQPLNPVGSTKVDYADSLQEISDYIVALKVGVKESICLSAHTARVRCMSIFKDLIVTGGDDQTLKLFSISQQKLLRSSPQHPAWIFSVIFSKDGSQIFSGCGDGTLKIWRTDDFDEIFSLKAHSLTLSCIGITNNYIITGSFDKYIKFWNIDTKEEIFFLEGHTEPIYSLTVKSNEKMLYTGSRDKNIKAWNIENRALEFTLHGHEHWLYSIILTVDEKFLISSSEDKSIKVWSLLEKKLRLSLIGHTHCVTCLAVTPDNKYIASGSDSVLKLWSISEAREVFSLSGHTSFLRSIKITNDNKYIVTTGDDKTTKFWNISEKKEDFILNGHANTVTSLDVNNTYLVSASEDKTVKLWELESNKLEANFDKHKDRVFCVIFSEDGKFAISCSADRTVKIWNIKEKRLETEITDFLFWIRCVFNIGDWIYCGCDDNIIYAASISEKCIKYTLKGHSNYIYCFTASDNKEILASGSSDKTIILWDTNSHNIICTLSGHTGPVNCIKFYKSSQYLISGSADFSLKIWNLELQREEFSFIGHQGIITSLILTNDPEVIISGSDDKTIKAWNITERRQDYSLTVHSAGVNSLAAYYNSVITGSTDKSIKLWNISEPKSVSVAPLSHQSNLDFTATVCGFNTPYPSLTETQASLRLSKNLFTLPHLFCHAGEEEKLQACLSKNPDIIKDKFGNSPLYYSLTKKSQPCTDLILAYMIGLSGNSRRYLSVAYALRDDLLSLLYNSSSHLPNLFNTLLIVQAKEFGRPNSNLAIVRQSEIQKIYTQDFLVASNFKSGSTANQELQLQFSTTAFKFPTEVGSDLSLKLIKSMLDCNNRQIFRSALIQHYIKSRWSILWYEVLIYALLVWMNLFIILLFIIIDKHSLGLNLIFIGLNLVILFVKIIQALNSNFVEFISQLWNLLDIVRLLMTVIWLLNAYLEWDSNLIIWLTIFVNFIKGVTGFRAFNRTRFYVKLFFWSFRDIFFFMLIFFYSTLGFGMLFCSTRDLNASELIKQLWFAPFDLNLGNFDSNSELSMDYLGFFLVSIVNVIVLLSLLISILGDSFDRFQSEVVEIDHTEMAELVYDLELLFFWRKKRNNIGFLQICDCIKDSSQKYEWEGNAKEIQNQLSRIIDQKIKPLQMNIDDLHSTTDAIDEKLALLNEHALNLDLKLESLIKLLHK